MEKISVILEVNNKSQLKAAEINQMLESLIGQNYPEWEAVLTVSKDYDSVTELIRHERIRIISSSAQNRASAINEAVKSAEGEYIVLVNNAEAEMTFRLSTLETFLLCAEKNPDTGLIYADYRLTETDGKSRDIHLLGYHEGRLRDNMDMGSVFFIPKNVFFRAGGLDESLSAALFYDLRLKIAAEYSVYHINAAVNGYLYHVKTSAKKHNVFDYLLSGKAVQLEMEEVLARYLKKTGSWLAPGAHYRLISYTPEEEKKFEECVASVVIPVFNRKEFIGTAIESVQAQTVQNVEVIIVSNGGKNDPTIEGVKPYLPGGEKYDPDKPEVRLFIEDVNNLGFCLNKGLLAAHGKYYVQLDSDDRLKPDAVEKIVSVFESDSKIGMVIGSYEVWVLNDENGEITRMKEIPAVTHDEWTEENGRNNLLRINGAGAPRAAHMKIIQELGGFGMNDIDYCRNYGEDYDLVLRMSEQYRIGRVWEPIYDVIRHSGGTDHSIDQLTIDRNDNTKDLMRLEAVLRRRKLNGSQT